MTEPKQRSWLTIHGAKVSSWVSDLVAHPFTQIAFIVLCVGWFVGGWNVNLLTAALSIIAITLTQMVLNRQNERELDDRRRDVAMHAKLDELIAVSHRAKNKFVGIEEKEEKEIVELKEEVKEAIADLPQAERPAARATAKRAQVRSEARSKRNGRKTAKKKAAAVKR